MFAEARWTVLPPVAQISVIERFELHLHPVKVQIERKIGREIQEYISPKDKKPKTPVAPSKIPPSSAGEVSTRKSLDHGNPPVPPRLMLSRNTSILDGKDSSGRLRPLHRSASASSLRTGSIGPATPTGTSHASTPNHATETDEMRVRAKKRTFLFVGLES